MAKRIRVGNLYGIPLPNGKYAFGRIMQDAGIAIYEYIGDNIYDLPPNKNYQFIIGIYKTDINKDLIYLDYIPFENVEEEWPPPSYIYDVIGGGYDLYYKGVITPSTYEECKGKEATAIWHTYHIVDRILGDTKWGGILEKPF